MLSNGVNYIWMILRQVGPCQIETKVSIMHGIVSFSMIHCLANQRKSLKQLTSGGTYSFTRGIICIGHLSFRNTDLSGRTSSFITGWAGMMLWRSQQSSHEHDLLTEY